MMRKGILLKRLPRVLIGIPILFVLLWGLSGCSGLRRFTTISDRLDRKIVVDGQPEDWLGMLSFIKDENLLVGFMNDAENLYLCLQMEDRIRQFQVMIRGLTVWFDPQGGEGKKYGFRYPLGLRPGEPPPLLVMDPEDDRLANVSAESMTDMEIIESPKGIRRIVSLKDTKDVEIKVVAWGAGVVFELKIPLLRTSEHPYGAGAQPGGMIGIGFETSRLDFIRMPGGPPAGIPRGGMRAPMGGGMGGDSRRPGMSRPLKLWVIVRLSPEKTLAPASVASVEIMK